MKFHFGPCYDETLSLMHSKLDKEHKELLRKYHELQDTYAHQQTKMDTLEKEHRRISSVVKTHQDQINKKQQKIDHLEKTIKDMSVTETPIINIKNVEWDEVRPVADGSGYTRDIQKKKK